jgi:hypothetical protein
MGVYEKAAKEDPRLADLIDSAEALALAGAGAHLADMIHHPLDTLIDGMNVGFLTGFFTAARLGAEDAMALRGVAEVMMLSGVLGPAFRQLWNSDVTQALYEMEAGARERMGVHADAGCPCPRRGDCHGHGWAGSVGDEDEPLTPRICADHDHFVLARL